jgi:uridine kinase
MYFIAITGPVACGKSTIVRYFQSVWPDVVQVIQVDNYYLDRSDVPTDLRSEAHINYDEPDAIDFGLLLRHLVRLRSGLVVDDAPIYDFSTHTSSRRIRLEPKQVVLVDGHQLLHGIPSRLFSWDLCLFLDTPADLCFERRLLRDTTPSNGHSSASRTYLDVAEQHVLKTLPAQKTYVLPQAQHCDVTSPDADVLKRAILLFVLSRSVLVKK